jgi:general secretion pathway protein G
VRGFTLLEMLLAMPVMSLLAGIAVPVYTSLVERALIAQAVADIGAIDMKLERHYSNNFTYPDSLDNLVGDLPQDPWGRDYQFLLIRGNAEPGLRGRLRKDRNLVPINSDYDLYSIGDDGESRPPLAACASHDDVIRASDGGFVGSAVEF